MGGRRHKQAGEAAEPTPGFGRGAGFLSRRSRGGRPRRAARAFHHDIRRAFPYSCPTPEVAMDDVRTYTGTLVADLVLPGARSLKDRRAPLRSLVQRLRDRDLAAAQVGPPDLQQRAFIAVAAVSGSAAGVDELLDAAERILFASDFEVGAVTRDVRVETFASGA
jgi:uncharacterized protein YlxP (DUF503 family)